MNAQIVKSAQILNLHKRSRSLLVCLLLGDALGARYETMTPDEIHLATGGTGVSGFGQKIVERYRTRLESIPADKATDDTQLTVATAESLIRTGRFDLVDQARILVEAYEKSKYGWGGTLAAAAEELKEWFESGGRQGRRPNSPATVRERGLGSGNGVAMRVAPLAIHSALVDAPQDSLSLIERSLDLGRLTHADPRAGVAAATVACVIRACLLGRLPIHNMPKSVTEAARTAELKAGLDPEAPDSFHSAVTRAVDLRFDFMRLRSVCGTSSHCMESVPFSLALFLRYRHNVHLGMLAAINCGGDTDTTAAMIGAMTGSQFGLDHISRSWIESVPETSDMMTLADRLVERFVPNQDQ